MSWKTFSTFLKTKVLTKTVGYATLGIASAATVCTVIGLKIAHPFKPSFYNYQAYMFPFAKEQISKDFDFKEFATLNEFTKAILTKKAVSGIGSDSQAVQLIRKGKLRKIEDSEFESIFGTTDRKSVYTDLVWNHMIHYDEILKTDINGNPLNAHLYDYFIPYFAQDMVVAYNPVKLSKLKLSYESEVSDKTKEKVRKKLDSKIIEYLTKSCGEYNGQFRLVDVLKALKNQGFNQWEITDAVRDNMIYGSSYRLNTATSKREEQFTGNAVEGKDLIYKDLIDQFQDLVRDGTGLSLTDKHMRFIGSGGEMLTNVLSPMSDVQVGILYNGDTLDAYFSTDNDERVGDGTVHFIRPRGNLLLVDGLVISADTNDYYYHKTIEDAKKGFFGGYDKDLKTWEDNIKRDPKSGDLEYDEAEYSSLGNFDKVCYTPAIKVLYDYAKKHYFEDISDPYELAYVESLYEIKNEYTILSPIDKTTKITYNVNHTDITPVTDTLITDINRYYDQKIKK